MWAAIRRWLFPVWCIGCGEPETGFCPTCAAAAAQSVDIIVDGLTVRAAGDYSGTLRDAILGLKRGERAYLDPLAALLAPLVPPGTAIVPVSTTRRRAAERGFDQARELAQRVAALRSGWVDDLLRKRGAPQRGRSRRERLLARGRFALRPGAEIPSHAVLLDDVVTTGATLNDAARVLGAAGCSVLSAVVVARTSAIRETPRRG
jgi:predicted amidophosphoribosyltransferase